MIYEHISNLSAASPSRRTRPCLRGLKSVGKGLTDALVDGGTSSAVAAAKCPAHDDDTSLDIAEKTATPWSFAELTAQITPFSTR